jgi:predicted metal-binding protein
MALFITLELISRPSAKMLSLAQHADYAQHLSVYAVSCTVVCKKNCCQRMPRGKGGWKPV